MTLDLNGYTITYAAGPYQHVPNRSFEDDFEHWDTSKAPDAKIEEVGGNWPFIGKKVCRLPQGQEIVSEYVTLPVANRSYYATCALLESNCKVTITVEDEQGNPVEYSHRVGEKTYTSCPMTAASKLDAGVVYAHFRGLPAGKYRVRVRSEHEDGAIIGEVDIRTSLDIGVALAATGSVWARYNAVAYSGQVPCLVDYLVKDTSSKLLPSVPSAKGNTKAVIRNGIIRNGSDGMHSWGLMSRGAGGTIELENLKFVSAGINTNAAFLGDSRGVIRNCRFETDTPFIIERHNVINCPVALGRAEGPEVSHCEFIGGQGNLYVPAAGAKIHDNLFVNRQRVTNHYAVAIVSARGVQIYNNRFAPDIGGGILIFRSRDCDVHHNSFKVNATQRSCKLYLGAGTIVGVRITDYNAKKGDPRGCVGNKVHDNEFHVTGGPAGRACGIFYSTGAGQNAIYDNKFVIDHKSPQSDMATGFYVGAANMAGEYTGNTITSNVPAFWIASGYGSVKNAVIRNNTFIKAANAGDDYQPIRIGYWTLTAENIEFRSNKFDGCDFGIQWKGTDTKGKKHSYSVFWTLTVKGAPGAEVTITDKDGNVAFEGKTGADGAASEELLEYKATAARAGRDYTVQKTHASPYKVKVGGQEKTVTLDGNKEVAF